MENIELPVKRIKRAQIRYYETNHNACEIPDFKAYTYFLEVDGVYINIFHPLEECNVYKRVPIPNFTQDGEAFGSKIDLVNGKEEDGVCYILENPDRLIARDEYISIKEFEKLIMGMNEFVVDRIEILGKKKDLLSKIRYRKIMESDMEKLKELQDYIIMKENETSKVYKKI